MSECKVSGAYAGMLALTDPDPELNSTDRAIYGLVVFRCNGERKRHISYEKIMTDLPHITTRQTIAASIKKLVATGRLKVSRQRYGANLYEVEDPTGRLYSKANGVKNTLHREGIMAEVDGVKPELHREAAGDGDRGRQILHEEESESYTADVKPALHQELHKKESQKTPARTRAREEVVAEGNQAPPAPPMPTLPPPGCVRVDGDWVPIEPVAPKLVVSNPGIDRMSRMGTPSRKTGEATINGFAVDAVLKKACDTARIVNPQADASCRKAVEGWLAAGIEASTIYETLRITAARDDYRPPFSLMWFDKRMERPSARWRA